MRLSGYLGFSERYETLDPGFYSHTGPEKALDARLKGWKFTSFWVEKHELHGFLGCFLLLWMKSFPSVEFCVLHPTIDNEQNVFVSVSMISFMSN